MNPSPHNWKEARRFQAWTLKRKGWSQRQIAEALGVSEGAVSQWMTRAHEEGPEALRQPMRRARQRHEAAIARWRDETWPAIKKGRRLHSKPSCF